MRRRSKLVKLTVLPALATACATAPVRDDSADRIDRGMRSERYSAETPGAEGIALQPDEAGYAEDGAVPEGYGEEDGYVEDEVPAPPLIGADGYYWGSGFYGYSWGGGYPRICARRSIVRGGFGHYFGGSHFASRGGFASHGGHGFGGHGFGGHGFSSGGHGFGG